MAYEYFYQYYDALMNDVPYEEYLSLIKSYVTNTDKILDLGCGTGTVLIKLLSKGYNVDGIDISDEMLLATQNKLKEHNFYANLYQDDMRNINIKVEYNLIISLLDSINYLTTKKDIEKTFNNIYNALKDNGYFIFDIHSLNKVHNIFDGYSYGENKENFSYIWNTFVERRKEYSTLYHELTFFIKTQNNYKKLDEFHKQVVYPVDYYVKALEKSKFKIEKILFDLDGKICEDSCDKIFFIVKKCI